MWRGSQRQEAGHPRIPFECPHQSSTHWVPTRPRQSEALHHSWHHAAGTSSQCMRGAILPILNQTVAQVGCKPHKKEPLKL